MSLLLKTIAFILLLFSLFMMYDQYEMRQKVHFDALERIDPLPEAMKLVQEGEYVEASEYLALFIQYDYVKNNPKVMQLYEALETKRASYSYQGEKAVEGVIYGRSDEMIGKVSAGVSDFFLFGDLRDLAIEGYHHFTGEEVDKVLVGLSTIGVVATGATMFSAGSSAPLKGGVSFLKLVRKSGKMPLWMEKFILKSAKSVKSTKDIKPVKSLFEDIYTTTKATGINTSMKLIDKSANMKAFRNSLGFAKTFGKNSGALMRVLGDDAVIYYRLLKDKASKKIFLNASTYGKAGVKQLAKVGEKGFLRSLKAPVKISRLTKIFNKNVTDLLGKVHISIYLMIALVSIGILT